MRSRSIGLVVVFCALALMLVGGNLAHAQSGNMGKPVLYTYVSEWAVPRAMWGDYLKQEAAGDADMNKLVADGTLIAWGRYSILNHQDGQPTHGSWFSANSMANIIKALEPLRSTPDSTSPVLAASKHWDLVLRSSDYNAHSGMFKNGYLRVGFWNPKAGSTDQDGKIMRSTMVAVLEKLLADGALHGYQIDTEAVHSSDPGQINIAIIANGADGIDKFDKALQEWETNNPATYASLSSLLDPRGHRDILAHVDAMNHK
jgi:hypothetical protein